MKLGYVNIVSYIVWYCNVLDYVGTAEVTDGQVIRAGVSVTWNVLS